MCKSGMLKTFGNKLVICCTCSPFLWQTIFPISQLRQSPGNCSCVHLLMLISGVVWLLKERKKYSCCSTFIVTADTYTPTRVTAHTETRVSITTAKLMRFLLLVLFVLVAQPYCCPATCPAISACPETHWLRGINFSTSESGFYLLCVLFNFWDLFVWFLIIKMPLEERSKSSPALLAMNRLLDWVCLKVIFSLHFILISM